MPSSTEGCKPQGRTVICVTHSRAILTASLSYYHVSSQVCIQFVTLTNSHYLFRYTTKFLPQFLHHVIQQGIGEMHAKLKLNQSLLKETIGKKVPTGRIIQLMAKIRQIHPPQKITLMFFLLSRLDSHVVGVSQF